MRTTLIFWRWRRNTLRRGTDRVEAWVVLVAGILFWLGAPAVGAVAGTAMSGHTTMPGPDWHRVTAVLVHNAPPAPQSSWSAVGASGLRVSDQVSWTAADGSVHTAEMLVAPDSPAGTRVPVWLDGHGTLRDQPTNPAQAEARAAVFGLMATTTTGLTVLGVRCVAVDVMKRRRAAALEREWAHVGPNWGHHPA